MFLFYNEKVETKKWLLFLPGKPRSATDSCCDAHGGPKCAPVTERRDGHWRRFFCSSFWLGQSAIGKQKTTPAIPIDRCRVTGLEGPTPTCRSIVFCFFVFFSTRFGWNRRTAFDDDRLQVDDETDTPRVSTGPHFFILGGGGIFDADIEKHVQPAACRRRQ